MNFEKFKDSLKYRKYNNFKILIRFIEFKIKNLFINLIINFNFIKLNSKPSINLGSFSDNRFINFLLYSLKDDFIFLYEKDKNTKKLFKRIGFLNFFKYTHSNTSFKNHNKFNILINQKTMHNNDINFDTDYFKYFYDKEKNHNEDGVIMPYYMYPRIYNSFYSKINIKKNQILI